VSICTLCNIIIKTLNFEVIYLKIIVYFLFYKYIHALFFFTVRAIFDKNFSK
jgi:hypothetical protein